MSNTSSQKNVSNFVNRAGKKLLATTAMTALGLAGLSDGAKAANDWTGHTVIGGGGSIAYDPAAPANTTNITQTGARVKVQGDADIKAGWTVNVAQDSATSQYILFDVEGDATKIRGNLNANGEIFIFDTDGIIFGANSQVDVSSIIASSGSLASTDLQLDAGEIIINNVEGGGDVVMKGTISVAQAGLAGFVAPTVDNSGVINATMGKVAMAAGDVVTLDLYGDGLVEIAAGPELSDGLVKNSGDIIARGGQVKLAASVAKDAVDNVINMTGTINASSATVKGGKIILSGGDSGRVRVAGDVWANGTSGQEGGSIDVTGENITLTEDADLRTRSIFNGTGNAGDIKVIADNKLVVNGSLSALGLDGTGFIETSAPTTIFGAGASILANREWLLDPTDVVIDTAMATLIEAQLGAGNMTVQTPADGTDNGDVTFFDVVNWATDNTFKVIAHNDINFSNGGGVAASGLGNFVAEAGDDFRMYNANNGVLLNGGDATITTGDEFTIHTGFINVGGGNLVIDNTEQFEAIANSLQASGAGTITINQNKDVNGFTSTVDASIQNAVDAISNTGTGLNIINVGAGTWAESVNVDENNMVLKGANAGISAVDGVRVAETIVTPNSPGFYVTGDNAIIDGFTVDGAGASGNNGIEADGVNNFTAVNNIVKNNTDTAGGRAASDWTTGVGVLVNNATGNINISDNDANNNTDGIRVLDSDAAALGDIIVRDNAVTDNGDKGIIIKNSDNVRVSANDITGNKTGIWLETSSNGLVNNNDVDDSTENGIRLRNGSDGNELRNNRVDGAGHNGIKIAGGDNNQVLNNKINNVDDDGIDLENSDGTLIENNKIGLLGGEDNIGDDGIDLDDSNNTIIRNNNIQNVVENGIDNINSHGTDMIDNTIRFVGGHGIYVNPSDDIRIIGNTITDAGEDGVHSEEGNDIRVRNNTIRRTGDDGIDITRNDFVRVTGNTVTDTDRRGISVERARGEGEDVSAVIADNTVRRTGRTGIVLDRFTTGRVVDNTVKDSNRAGIRVERGDDARIRRNTVRDVRRDGINVDRVDVADIRRNTVRRAGWDGINLDRFDNAWIAYNDIKWTGDDGVDAQNGSFVSIYDNYIDLAGFLPGELFGNKKVGDDANGIYVQNVTGDIPEENVGKGYGYSLYDANVEIYNNDVANTEDDGVQVVGREREYEGEPQPRIASNDDDNTYSAYIVNNLIGHLGDDGVDVDGVDHVVVADNIITLAEDSGITIRDGEYAGVFDNRILLTGTDGIRVNDVNGNGSEVVQFLGDEEYGYGWSVNVSGNEIAFTGDDGIDVGDSGATKITRNNIFAAGLGEDLEEVIEVVNSFASETFNPFLARRGAPSSVEEAINGFTWEWGDGNGISVDNVYGSYYSPNGWAVDIRNNDVNWTGGHGIVVEESDRTRIKNNRVSFAGVDETYFYGAQSMGRMLSSGPFANEGRRDLWRSEGHGMIDVLDSYIGREEEPGDDEGYTIISDIYFDNHDGIHAEYIYGEYEDGLSGRSYLYDLKIKGNNVNVTGDDGIEVDSAGRTLIANNKVRHAGTGDGEDYESEDFYGADGIHARNVTASVYNGRPTVSRIGENTSEDGYYYEPAENYALIIRNNVVKDTADDGIEVVGNANNEDRVTRTGGIGDIDDDYYYYGETDRVLIAENKVRRAGIIDNDYNYDGPNTGEDGYGHDGIHVRGISGTTVEHVWLGEGDGAGEGYEGRRFSGYAVDIIGNDVARTGDDGIEVYNSDSTLIYDNDVKRAGVGGGYYYGGADYFGADGIHVRNVGIRSRGHDYWDLNFAAQEGGVSGDGFEPYSVVISNNRVDRTQDDGIEVVGHNRLMQPTLVNLVYKGDWDEGRSAYTGTGRTLIERNEVNDAGFRRDREDFFFYGDGYGADGIHVRGVQNNFFNPWVMTRSASAEAGGYYGGGNYDVQIRRNTVTNSDDDGIEVLNTNRVLVARNTVDESGDDGIRVINGRFFDDVPSVTQVSLVAPSEELYYYGPRSKAVIRNNDVSNSGTESPEETEIFSEKRRFGGDGIQVGGFELIRVRGNDVTNSVENGLYVSGPGNGRVVVFDNDFTGFDIGAHFESGRIDLTTGPEGDREGNTFTDGRTGMRFSPVVVGYEYPEDDFAEIALAFGDPIYSFMELVDDTIGAQTFTSIDDQYVELDNGAFFDPGTPTLLNALDSTYVGTPFGTVTPSVDFPDGFSLEQLAFFENKFFHFNDDGTLGLFFFPLLPEINQEDIFQFFGPNADALGGLQVTILGLPSIPGGTPVALNNIEPAAGGETDPAALNAIEAAAGGDEEGGNTASCFSGATVSAAQNGPVNISYTGDAEDLLNGEESCTL